MGFEQDVYLTSYENKKLKTKIFGEVVDLKKRWVLSKLCIWFVMKIKEQMKKKDGF